VSWLMAESSKESFVSNPRADGIWPVKAFSPRLKLVTSVHLGTSQAVREES
jgi:hypothetical protein